MSRTGITGNVQPGASGAGVTNRRARPWLVAAAAALAAAMVPSLMASVTPCGGEPLYITDHCQDPIFHTPVIDLDEARGEPVPHRYVTGHFEGTDAKFSLYFPLEPEQYQGRFFQFTHQLIRSENATDINISFAMDSGGYLVQTNMGGSLAIRTAEAGPVEGLDPTVVGYRANAAAARFSRQMAADIFGEHRPFGYLTGGSGGALQTFASMQNTEIWDGGVPFVQPAPQAAPNVYTARIHGLRILRDGAVNRFPEILDAIDPGGSGDPYATLDQEQREALEEVTRLGFPPRGWFDYPTMTVGALRFVAAYVPLLDPDYFEDYWLRPGYLGHDDPYGTVAESLVEGSATVSFADPLDASAEPASWLVGLAGAPDSNIVGAELLVTGGAAEGRRLSVFQASAPGVFVVLGDAEGLGTGDQVAIDNRDYLALQTYHRHQVPDPERYARLSAPREHFPPLPEIFPPMPAWNQFLDDEGNPIYPQREVLVAPASTFYGSGSILDGHFHGKMIGLQTMMDIDAFPWKADWNREVIHQAGNGERYRLYFVDHADHSSGPVTGSRQARITSYRGALEQTLRHLAAWVEEGVEPPAETRYTLDEAQVVLPKTARQRLGIQPVVHLRANGGERAEVGVGEAVRLTALVEVPEGSGSIVRVEWDFEGDGRFVPGNLEVIHPGNIRGVVEHRYTEPGTYFPVLRVASHQGGDPEARHALVQNLGRARVVVEARE